MTGDSTRRLLLVLLAGIALGIAMRWAFPSADPPLARQTGALWWDEAWSMGARNGVLYGEWQQDDYKPWVVSPLHTVIVEQALTWLGLNPFGLRFTAMMAGTLLVAFAVLQSRLLGLSWMAAALAAFMLATSWSLTGFSKTMTLEPTLMLFFQLSITLILAGERVARGRIACYLLAGFAAGCATLCKTSGAAMTATMVAFLVLGPVVAAARPWRWRVLRSFAYGAASLVAYGIGYALWVAPSRDTFVKLALDEAFYRRADTSLFMRAYKAVTWLDSEAFLSAPWLVVAVLLLLPLLWRAAKGVQAPMQRFGFWLAFAGAAFGVLLLIQIDVPARRTVYINTFLALLAAIAYDWMRNGIVKRDSAHLDTRFQQGAVLAALVIAGHVLSGWLVSPHGGLLALLDPPSAAYVLFTMKWKVASKASWLAFGMVFGCLLYRYRDAIWQRAPRVLGAAIGCQLALYVASSGLWLARMTHTIEDGARTIEETVGQDARVLGADAAAFSFHNTTRPLFWAPKGYHFANYDDAKIEAVYNPRYMVMTELTWERLHDGEYGDQPYAKSFNRERARFPIYELHESLTLTNSILVMERRRD